MTRLHRVLLVEDSLDDALLVELQLRRAGVKAVVERVDTAEAFAAALDRGGWDIVLTDHALPKFSSADVLRMIRERGLDLPCVIVSGRIGEEAAVSSMRGGAAGYVPKDHLAQLDTAFLRAVREAEDRRARGAAEGALRVSEERYALAAAGSNDGLWDWDLLKNEVYFSPRWQAMLGFRPGELKPDIEEWLGRVHPQDVVRVRTELDLHLNGSTPHFESEHRVLHRDGTWRWMLVRGLAVRDATGRATRIAGSMSDITRHKETEEQLAHGALHDALTGLPNRVLFMDRLWHALGRVRRNPSHMVAVLVFDLDRFKLINDSLGHGIGDQLLLHIARLLETCVRPGDTVARMGGDEFAVLLEDVRDPSEPTRLATKIQDALRVPFRIGGRDVFTTASIGIAVSAGDALPEDLLRDADTAMYQAKAMGKARHVVFDVAMHDHAVALLQIETDLRRAIERDEFRVLYQPVVSLETGTIVSFEALVRWQHPQRGLVSPAEFVPIAEETGLIVPIGRIVLRQACREARRWLERARRPFSISVNLSGRQFSQPELLDEVRAALTDTDLDPDRLTVEITETVLIENAERAAALLGRLRDMAIHVSLDDFGTGYSSLNYLHRFKVDTLKIDKSFVDRIGGPEENSAIVGTIAALANHLGMDVIAEGVETIEQARRLAQLKCRCGQGFLFSKPVGAHDCERMLVEDRTWLRAS